jgi:photosystem I protein PsaO
MSRWPRIAPGSSSPHKLPGAFGMQQNNIIQNRHSCMRACVRRWTVPANIGVPAFGGNSLFGLFTQSIGENLAKFPVGPGLTDKFWCAALPHSLRPCCCGVRTLVACALDCLLWRPNTDCLRAGLPALANVGCGHPCH